MLTAWKYPVWNLPDPTRSREKHHRNPISLGPGSLGRRELLAWGAGCGLAGFLSLQRAFAGPEPDLVESTLDSGPFATMRMVMRRHLLFRQIDVAEVKVRLGTLTASRVRGVLESGPDALEDAVAEVVLETDDCLISLDFLRNIPLSRYLAEARKGVDHSWRAGLISREHCLAMKRKFVDWYRPLEKRGIRTGDRMFFRIREDVVRSVSVGFESTVFLDLTRYGREAQLGVLGAYFVEGSEFRGPLARSLPGART